MRIISYGVLIFVAIVIMSFIAAILMSCIDESKRKDQAKKDSAYNQKMIDMCRMTTQKGCCPNVCEKCAWSARMKDGVITLGGKT